MGSVSRQQATVSVATLIDGGIMEALSSSDNKIVFKDFGISDAHLTLRLEHEELLIKNITAQMRNSPVTKVSAQIYDSSFIHL